MNATKSDVFWLAIMMAGFEGFRSSGSAFALAFALVGYCMLTVPHLWDTRPWRRLAPVEQEDEP